MTSSDSPGTVPKGVRPLDWAAQPDNVPIFRELLQKKVSQNRRRRKSVAITAVGGATVLALAFWMVPVLRDVSSIETAPGHRQSFTLADGSTAEFNAHSEARTDFRYGRRIVHLTKGEAFFSVVKDPSRPFLVETPAGTVRVTGTQFDVRLDNADATVTLVEGSVAVKRDALPDAALHAGEQLSLEKGTQPLKLTSAEIEGALSWRTGRLVLSGMTLGEAVSRFAAFHDKVISVAPTVASLPLGGECPLDDLPGFLAFLGESAPVQVVDRGNGSFTIIAR
jgi:transmembrane sensor